MDKLIFVDVHDAKIEPLMEGERNEYRSIANAKLLA